MLAKPVRPGLHALAQGSLLQCFALAVGAGRIIEEPVKWAISVMFMSDVEGQGRVRQVIDALASFVEAKHLGPVLAR